MTKREVIKEVIHDFEPLFDDAQDAEVTIGWESAYKYLKAFIVKLENMTAFDEKELLNPYFMVYDLETGDVYTVHDYGRTRILHAFFITCNLLPVSFIGCIQCTSIKELQHAVGEIVDEYKRILNEAIEETLGINTFILVGYDGRDNYVGFNILDQQVHMIGEYKTYREQIYVDGKKISSSEVSIITLPENLYHKLCLNVKTSIACRRCEWNGFEVRKPHEKKEIDLTGCARPEKLKAIYAMAVDALNKSFIKDIGCEKELIELERDILFLETVPHQIATETGTIWRIGLNTLQILGATNI